MSSLLSAMKISEAAESLESLTLPLSVHSGSGLTCQPAAPCIASWLIDHRSVGRHRWEASPLPPCHWSVVPQNSTSGVSCCQRLKPSPSSGRRGRWQWKEGEERERILCFCFELFAVDACMESTKHGDYTVPLPSLFLSIISVTVGFKWLALRLNQLQTFLKCGKPVCARV